MTRALTTATKRWKHAGLGLAVLTFLSGCSSFNRDWRHAANHPSPEADITGRWEGRWQSEANQHQGKLRCLLTKSGPEQYLARFRATYLGILHFESDVTLLTHSMDGLWQARGTKDLGNMAGGVFDYEGRITPTRFDATYKSREDHGIFEMTRPK